MERVFKALAEPSRCRILSILNERCLPAGEISRRMGMPKPTLSAHLAVLRNAELVSVERDGTRIIYSLRRQFLQDGLAGFARSFDSTQKRNGACDTAGAMQGVQQSEPA
jgi:DNA-binding transcriptional ArsR family regulator